MVIDDVSGDGKLDLVVANSGENTLTNRFGTGTGTFGSPSTLPVGNLPRGLAVALNNDGKQDLVVANNEGGAHGVSVPLGTGSGAFATAVAYVVDGYPRPNFPCTMPSITTAS